MNIKLAKFDKVVKPNINTASCLEFVLTWGQVSEDTAGLLRVHAGAIGVALDEYQLLPAYKPERDKILNYGFKCLERLLDQGVSTDEIYKAGGQVLQYMLERIPKQKEVEKKESFFSSPKQESKDT